MINPAISGPIAFAPSCGSLYVQSSCGTNTAQLRVVDLLLVAGNIELDNPPVFKWVHGTINVQHLNDRVGAHGVRNPVLGEIQTVSNPTVDCR